jgi:glucose/arabinose dehydrogenase
MGSAKVALATLAAGLVAWGASAADTRAGGGLRLVHVVGGLDAPTHLAAAPGEQRRLYIVEKDGRIRVRAKGKLRAEPFLDIPDLVGSEGGEQGLFSVAFHPEYATNRLFYVSFTNEAGDNEVVEYRSDGVRAVLSSRRPLLLIDHPYENHNGGQLAFGPEGLLYAGFGDGGSQGDPGDNAQTLSSRLGKILRLDVGKPQPTPELVAYGARNPWRFSFDRLTGDLWIADVGGGTREEVDFLPAGSGLANLGWDVYEGSTPRDDGALTPGGTLVFPVHEYSHSTDRCSITGGFVYRGRAIPAAVGRYFYGDFCTGEVESFRLGADAKATDLRTEPVTVPLLSSFGEGPRGELYLLSLDGDVYRLAAPLP